MEEKIFKHNGKDFVFVDEYMDEKYGKIIKAVTTKLKDFERIYYIKKNENLVLITDVEILKYIYEKYERIYSDVIFSEDDLKRPIKRK